MPPLDTSEALRVRTYLQTCRHGYRAAGLRTPLAVELHLFPDILYQGFFPYSLNELLQGGGRLVLASELLHVDDLDVVNSSRQESLQVNPSPASEATSPVIRFVEKLVDHLLDVCGSVRVTTPHVSHRHYGVDTQRRPSGSALLLPLRSAKHLPPLFENRRDDSCVHLCDIEAPQTVIE